MACFAQSMSPRAAGITWLSGVSKKGIENQISQPLRQLRSFLSAFHRALAPAHPAGNEARPQLFSDLNDVSLGSDFTVQLIESPCSALRRLTAKAGSAFIAIVGHDGQMAISTLRCEHRLGMQAKTYLYATTVRPNTVRVALFLTIAVCNVEGTSENRRSNACAIQYGIEKKT